MDGDLGGKPARLHCANAAPDFFAVHMGAELVQEAVEAEIGAGDESEFGVGEFVAQGSAHGAAEGLQHGGIAKINYRLIALGMQNFSHLFQQRKHFAGASIGNILAENKVKDALGEFYAV